MKAISDVDCQSWDRLFDQFVAGVGAAIEARQDREASSQNCQSKLSLYSAVDPDDLANSIDLISQLREVLDLLVEDSLVESPSAGHPQVCQDLDEPQWSDSDTAREMQSSIGQPG